MAGHIRPQTSYRTIFTEPDVHVFESNDLPSPSNGTITLENKVYRIHGFVNLGTDNLDISNSPIFKGQHGGSDGLIYTGGGDMLTGTDGAFFAADLSFDAPGGTIFNISGDTTTEILAESCNFADPTNLGNLASLGTIDGFRVPSFKGCNFEDFNGGLTFTGTSDKIFISESPLRGVTQSNVTILEFDANCDTDIVDLTDSYVKGVQSDTVVIDVDPSATIADIFQYRGTTHDQTVTESNILTGAAGVGEVGYRVESSYPLSDSGVIGELSLDSPTETTISTQDTYTAVSGATSLGNETERVSQTSNGVLQYDGKKDVKVQITSSCTVEGGSNETYALAIAKNGTVEPTSEARIEGTGNTPKFAGPSSIEDLTTGDTISIQVKNIDGTSNVTFDLYNLNFSS
jgi:hypothetical protein